MLQFGGYSVECGGLWNLGGLDLTIILIRWGLHSKKLVYTILSSCSWLSTDIIVVYYRLQLAHWSVLSSVYRILFLLYCTWGSNNWIVLFVYYTWDFWYWKLFFMYIVFAKCINLQCISGMIIKQVYMLCFVPNILEMFYGNYFSMKQRRYFQKNFKCAKQIWC